MAKWEKGQSGNPKGRAPKGQTITDLLRQELDRQKFVEALLELCYAKDLAAIKLVINYVDGLPVQPVEENSEVKVTVVYEDLLELEDEDDAGPDPEPTPSA